MQNFDLFDQPGRKPGQETRKGSSVVPRTGRELRDHGAQMTLDAEHSAWQEHVLWAIGVYAGFGRKFTCDDLREWIDDEPHAPSCWGAVFLGARRKGIIAKTGEYRQSSRPSSRARAIPLYTKA